MSERDDKPNASGHCHCGAVTYDIHGPLRRVIECHCESCRRVSGGLWHGTAVRVTDIDIHDHAGALAWYRSSDKAQRGFCNKCGSSLFFRRDGADRMAVAGGSLNRPTDLEFAARIFTGETADYGDWRSEVATFEEWAPADFFEVPEA